MSGCTEEAFRKTSARDNAFYVFSLASLEILDVAIQSIAANAALDMHDHNHQKAFRERLMASRALLDGITEKVLALDLALDYLKDFTHRLIQVSSDIRSLISELRPINAAFATALQNASQWSVFSKQLQSKIPITISQASFAKQVQLSDHAQASNKLSNGELNSALESFAKSSAALLVKINEVHAHQFVNRINSEFEALGGSIFVKRTKAKHNARTDDLSVAEMTVDVLIFSKPPQLTQLRLKGPVLLFLHLLKDRVSNELAYRSLQHKQISNSYQAFMSALNACDSEMECLQRLRRETKVIKTELSQLHNELSTGDFQESTRQALKQVQEREYRRLQKESQEIGNEQTITSGQIREAIALAKSGDTSRAKSIRDRRIYMAYKHLDLAQLDAVIDYQMSTLHALSVEQKGLLREFNRINTLFRRIYGRGDGKAMAELVRRISVMNDRATSVTWAAGSELSKNLRNLVVKVMPACRLAGLDMRWEPKSLDDLVAEHSPSTHDAQAAFLNALCAVAAADGHFCLEEVHRIQKACESFLCVTEAHSDEMIKSWRRQAETIGIQRQIAQSISDVLILRNTTFAAPLSKHLIEVAKADGLATRCEGAVYTAIMARLE